MRDIDHTKEKMLDALGIKDTSRYASLMKEGDSVTLAFTVLGLLRVCDRTAADLLEVAISTALDLRKRSEYVEVVAKGLEKAFTQEERVKAGIKLVGDALLRELGMLS